MVAKAKIAVGVFAGILNSKGKLLLRRRTEVDSIIPGKSFKGNWELCGGGIMETDEQSIPYNYAVKELKREVEEEVGVKISIPQMPPFYSVMFKGPAGYDLAMVTPVQQEQILDLIAEQVILTKGEVTFVSTEELNTLAREFVPADKKNGIDGKGLVSGYGKRMHCMALLVFTQSRNDDYSRQAVSTLVKIQEGWNK
jgi:8-oxo-dGTP pyrophosphatase MutT (NUDIX family)